jgi:putative ABC transport system ATP-binding protein
MPQVRTMALGQGYPAEAALPPVILLIEGMGLIRRDGSRSFALDVPSFRLRAGEKVAIVGRSGSGKSSFIELIACARAPSTVQRFAIRRPDGGGKGINVAAAWTSRSERRLIELRARTFGYVQQTGGLLDFLTVRENIALTQTLSGRKDPERILMLAETLGIAHLLRQRPSRLSGGERQRVVIARALAHRPSILVADEPTSSLDEGTGEQVLGLLHALADQEGVPLLVASHDRATMTRHGFSLAEVTERPMTADGAGGSSLQWPEGS